MIRSRRSSALSCALVALGARRGIGRRATAGRCLAPAATAFAPNVGQAAPDFTLPGATRFGLLKNPVQALADYRGQTVVLAFFPKARTKG